MEFSAYKLPEPGRDPPPDELSFDGYSCYCQLLGYVNCPRFNLLCVKG